MSITDPEWPKISLCTETGANGEGEEAAKMRPHSSAHTDRECNEILFSSSSISSFHLVFVCLCTLPFDNNFSSPLSFSRGHQLEEALGLKLKEKVGAVTKFSFPGIVVLSTNSNCLIELPNAPTANHWSVLDGADGGGGFRMAAASAAASLPQQSVRRLRDLAGMYYAPGYIPHPYTPVVLLVSSSSSRLPAACCYCFGSVCPLCLFVIQ